nr:isoform 2 of lysm domain receptor-like kinase 3 [Quercus suber]
MRRNRGGFERYTQQNWRYLNVIDTPEIQSFCQTKESAGAQTGMPLNCSVISISSIDTGRLTRQWTLLQGWVVDQSRKFPLPPPQIDGGDFFSEMPLLLCRTDDQSRKFPPPPPQTDGGDPFSETPLLFHRTDDQNGTFPPLRTGISSGAIACMSIAAVAGASILAFFLYERTWAHITMDKSVEFSYEELAKATDDFSLNNKLGQGGFGSVYYAELRGEKAAIKKMDMQASKEFLSELKVLTNVHHLNLVRLIGYCVEGSLFLVYEYIENGNLSQHLHSSRRDPLPWSTRVNIALDSARGLEYIHEYTVPVYIHRDIKSANILIDEKFRGKVADFGLTKLTEYGTASLNSSLAGTFGYMSPEYTQYGKISPKIDWDLLLCLKMCLAGLTQENIFIHLWTLDLVMITHLTVCKLVELANACTQEDPQLRPSMRLIVVALMSLSSSTED